MKWMLILLLIIPLMGSAQIEFDTIYYLGMNQDSTDHEVYNRRVADGTISYEPIDSSNAYFHIVYDDTVLLPWTIQISRGIVYPTKDVYYSKSSDVKVIIYKDTFDTQVYYDYDPNANKYLSSTYFCFK